MPVYEFRCHNRSARFRVLFQNVTESLTEECSDLPGLDYYGRLA